MKQQKVQTRGLPRLKHWRMTRGYSLGSLAASTENLIKRDTIAQLESGQVDPQPHQVRLLARILGVLPADLHG